MKHVITLALLYCSLGSIAQTKDLNYFLQHALQNSPQLKDYNLQQASNRIDSLRLRSSLLPQVTGNGSATYAPYIHGFGYDPALSNYHTLNALVTVSKQFLNKADTRNQFEAIQLTTDSIRNHAMITEQELKRDITQQYITVYGETAQIKFNKDMLHLMHEEEILLKKLTQKSVYKQTDFLAFLVTEQQQELALSKINMQYRNDLAQLNYLTGLTDTAFTLLPAPEVFIPALPAPDQTIFFQQFKIDSLKTLNSDRQIDFSYRPKINVYGDGGYSSSFETKPYKNFGVSAGVIVTIPIYDGKQKKMQHDKNRLAEQIRKGYMQFARDQYERQVAQLREQLQLTEKMIQQATTEIKYAETLMEAQRKQLATGDVHIADYIISIGNYLNAKNIIADNTISRLQIINQLNYWDRKN